MDIFAVLTDSTRRSILELLCKREHSAGEISDAFPHLYQPTVSHHLKIMRDAGLLERRSQAQRRIYRIRKEGFIELDSWVQTILKSDPMPIEPDRSKE